MKATGVVRRVDDLGRIVIPKEIRRTMHIREGEPMEIFIDSSGSVIFKKYSPMGELSDIATQLAESLYKEIERPCAICDRDGIIAAAGMKCEGKKLSRVAEGVIEERRIYKSENMDVELWDGGPKAEVIIPVISGGDLSGCVVLMEGQAAVKEEEIRLAKMTATFMAKQMED
ncbi:MAG: stage V sporulation T C-terminal domain-containing protein [Clostridiaceae bacterium]|nr:stage V sporulation T C-terminal domain-containing protein [Clostridiaceae bacterium]